MMFLELSDDNTIDPDAAVKAEESIAAELQNSGQLERAALRTALRQLRTEAKANQAGPEVLEFLDDFMDSLGLQEEEDE
jgi:hypothetical protein